MVKSHDSDVEIRQSIIDACREMSAQGINQGTSGNISVRTEDGILLTPSGVPYDRMRPEDIVAMKWDGSWTASPGHVPSTEWRFHLDILKSKPEANAVVHAHPIFCTIIAIMNRSIPAIHYMIAAARRQRRPMRALCPIRHRGAVTRGPGRASLSPRLPAGPSRADRDRSEPAQGPVARGGGRSARQAISRLPAARRAAAAAGRRDRQHPQAMGTIWFA